MARREQCLKGDFGLDVLLECVRSMEAVQAVPELLNAFWVMLVRWPCKSGGWC